MLEIHVGMLDIHKLKQTLQNQYQNGSLPLHTYLEHKTFVITDLLFIDL